MMLFGAATVFVTTAALAWACLPNAAIFLSTNAAAARSQVTVSGSNFTDQPVQIRWASAGGPVLATATPSGGRFSVQITVPQVEAGVYNVFAVGSAATRQQPLEVTAPVSPPPAATPAASDPPSTQGDAPAQNSPAAPDQGTPAPAQGTTAPAKSSAPAKSTGAAPAKRPATASRPKPAAGNPSARTPASRSETPRRGTRKAGSQPAATAQAPVTSGQAVATRSGRPVFGGSIAPARPRTPARDAATARKDPRETAPRAPQTAPGPAATTRPEQLPSLTSKAHSPALDDGPDRRLGIGIALLALGIVIPLAGFMVAEARRRRASTRSARGR